VVDLDKYMVSVGTNTLHNNTRGLRSDVGLAHNNSLEHAATVVFSGVIVRRYCCCCLLSLVILYSTDKLILYTIYDRSSISVVYLVYTESIDHAWYVALSSTSEVVRFLNNQP